MDGITRQVQGISLSDSRGDEHDESGQPGESEHLLFNPRQEWRTAPERIPRFLFRIATPQSDGSTNEKWAKSQAAHDGEHSSREDIFSNLTGEKRVHVTQMLKLHLLWWPKDDLEDNFVSWTSSLLFVLQYILYRHSSDRDGSKLADIKLYMIDTTNFPRGTFMRDIDLLDIFRDKKDGNLERLRGWRTGITYSFGEYLSQGALKIEKKCQVISADVLFENNRLRRIQPKFGELGGENVNWAREVVRLRSAIWPSWSLPVLPLKELEDRLQAIEEILEYIRSDWKYPMAIYLAGLLGSEIWAEEHEDIEDDNLVLRYFRVASWQEDARKEFRPSSFNIVAGEMPELIHIEKLLQVIYKHSMLKMAMEQIEKAEGILSSWNFQNVFAESIPTGYAARYNPKGIISHTRRRLLSKLGAVQELCERLTEDTPEANRSE